MANIIVCADGTWNRPEEDIEKDYPTNVLKLARAIKPAQGEVKQHVFYDWGIGSYHSKVIAGSIGSGLHKNILDGYRYIVQNYAPNDKIYLFGFSRGAYTVRAICGLINNVGILKRPDANRIQSAWDIYKSTASKNSPRGAAALKFKSDYCHQSNKVHFVGVWDTVGALGVPFSFLGLLDAKDEFYDTKMGPNVSIARHALAIDEKRRDFAPTVWSTRPGVDLKQVWFSGVHSDIGGSYEPDKATGLCAADTPLRWMLDQAGDAGLKIEPHIRATLTDGKLADIHRSRRHIYRRNKPLHRELIIQDKPTRIHPSVKQRYEVDPKYRPPQLEALVESIGWDALDVGV